MNTNEELQPEQAPNHWRQAGASMIEYVLLLALIALVCVAALTYFGGSSGNSLKTSCHKILAADSSPGGC